MSDTCGQCNKLLDDPKSEIKCTGVCNKCYHAECCGLKVSDITKIASKNTWRCTSCKMTLRSGSATGGLEENIMKMFQDLKTDIFKRMDSDLGGFQQSLNYMSKSFDEFNKVLAEVREENKQQHKLINELKEENKLLQSKIAYLSEEVNDLQQYTRSTNVEISGIPETSNEDINTLVGSVATALGLTPQPGDVLIAHRVPTKSTTRPKPIIVQLRSKVVRGNWITAFKSRRNATCHDINPNLPKEKFYVNEHLTASNKALLFEAKRFAREHNYAYTWVSNGKVFVREKNGLPATRISSPDDIQRLRTRLAKKIGHNSG